MNECFIYDFETMSTRPVDGVIVSLGMLVYTESRFAGNPYTYEELLEQGEFVKFDVKDQVVNHGRKVQSSTVEWWSKQGAAAREKIKPLPTDVSISKLYDIMKSYAGNPEKVFTRGNTFDPMFVQSICGKEPYKWHNVRDTRSMIEGMMWGADVENSFIPAGLEDKFVHHDPVHDVVMDVMRMQHVAQMIG